MDRHLTRTAAVGAEPVLIGTLALGALVATATTDDGAVVCPFRRCTGGYCPGCGVTRGANRLVHGDLAGAWSHHPWVVVAAVQAIVLVALLASAGMTRRTRVRRLAIPILIANCALLIGIWVVRIANGTIPTGWL